MSDDLDHERAKEWAAQHWHEYQWPASQGYLAGLAAGRAESLTWTSEPPTVEGSYCIQPLGSGDWCAATVVGSDDGLRFADDGSSLAEYVRRWPQCRFAGPIPLPQEPPR